MRKKSIVLGIKHGQVQLQMSAFVFLIGLLSEVVGAGVFVSFTMRLKAMKATALKRYYSNLKKPERANQSSLRRRNALIFFG
jgi:hypothetical protein